MTKPGTLKVAHSQEMLIKKKLNILDEVFLNIDKNVEDNGQKRRLKREISNATQTIFEALGLLIDFSVKESSKDFEGISLTNIINNYTLALHNIVNALRSKCPDLAILSELEKKYHYGFAIMKKLSEAAKNDTELVDGFHIKDGVLLGYYGEEKEVIIPYEVHTIESGAFTSTEGIRRIKFGSNVKKIEAFAFANLYDLEYLYMSNGLEIIGDYAFANCKKLKELSIPATVTEIGISIIAGCNSLIYLDIDRKNEAFTLDSNCIISKKDNTIVCSNYISKIPSNEAFNIINASAFEGNTSLFIQIPSNITTIDSFAFYNSDIYEITIPKTVKKVCSGAFVNCNKLNRIIVESSETMIEDYAFLQCPCVERLVISMDYKDLIDNIYVNMNDNKIKQLIFF